MSGHNLKHMHTVKPGYLASGYLANLDFSPSQTFGQILLPD